MRRLSRAATLAVACASLTAAPHALAQQVTGTPGSPSATTTISGTQLPAPDPKFGGVIKTYADSSKGWWPPRIAPRKGSPNVLLIMTDDQGYGVSGTFGGVIPTPAMDAIAKAGLRFTQFHSTALCSPTRAALITGRNHHSVGFGQISEMATGFPGYDSYIPKDKATVGRILRDNGYATSWFGKNHNTPGFQYSSEVGPFDQWPSGMGFDYFYGFMGGETDQWHPFLFKDHTQIYPWIGHPGWNLITGMADDAIGYLRGLNAAAPDKPFFLYYVPGGTHAPHQPTPEWIEKFKGKFDMGWEKMRDSIFANQKRLGVIPPETQLTPWPDILPKWDTMSAVRKKIYAHEAEVYAAYVAYTDNEIGRVIQEVRDEGKFDNTLVIYISGDNGTSAEGTLYGTFNDLTAYNGILDLPEAVLLAHLEEWGSDKTYPHMAVQWAWAFDTPFKWTKQVASYFGGTRQGMVMSWPAMIKDAGGIRSQFHHMIDIAPTILEATQIHEPEFVDGIKQSPMEGVSMMYTFDKANANAPSRRTTQYFEMFANRAIYNNGWIATTVPPVPTWDLGTKPLPPISDYQWELYDITKDYSENNNLAASNPAKLKELQALFMMEAAKYEVLPLDNTVLPRIIAPRPSAVAGRTEFTYSGVLTGTPYSSAPDILDRDYTITANVTVPSGGGEGMIVTMGGRFAGYAMYLSRTFNWWYHEALFRHIGLAIALLGLLILALGKGSAGSKKLRFGHWVAAFGAAWWVIVVFVGLIGVGRSKPVFLYNLLDLQRFKWEGPALSAGAHTIVFDFKYAGPGLGKGGTGVLTVDGKEVDRKNLEHTIPFLMTLDENFDVGRDTRSGVDDLSYDPPFPFTGTIDKLTFHTGPSQMTAMDREKVARMMAAAKD